VNRRHAEHYAHLAEAAAPHLRGADQLEWVARLTPEVDNLRAAFLWALDNEDLDVALPIILSVCVNGIALGYTALALAETAAAVPQVDRHPLGPALLAQAAWGALLHGRLDAAIECDVRRADAERALGLTPIPSNFQAPGTIALFSGEPARALDLAHEWVATARAAADGYEVVQGLTFMAAGLAGTGDLAAAVRTMEEAVVEARRLANPSNLSWALTVYGIELVNAGDLARATPILEEAVAVGIEVGNQQGVGSALASFAYARVRLGDHLGGLATYLDAVDVQVRIGDRFVVDGTFAGLAHVFTLLGAHEPAAVVHGVADAVNDARPMWHELQDLRLQSIEECIVALGRDRYDELHARGMAMRDDDAVEYARRAAEPLLE